MARTPTVVVLGLLAGGLLVGRSWWSLRVWALPDLDAAALDGGAPREAQAEAWRAYDRVLQCEVLDPCLALLQVGVWEGDPGRIERTCAASRDRLDGLAVPAALSPDVRAAVELLRTYWLRELDGYVDQARAAAGTGGGGGWLGAGELDTCTAESVPARIDQLYGVVPPGSPPASCAQLGPEG